MVHLPLKDVYCYQRFFSTLPVGSIKLNRFSHMTELRRSAMVHSGQLGKLELTGLPLPTPAIDIFLRTLGVAAFYWQNWIK
jgi:hypothetical protein